MIKLSQIRDKRADDTPRVENARKQITFPSSQLQDPPHAFSRGISLVFKSEESRCPKNGVMRTIASWFPNSDTTQPRHSTCVLSACQGCASPLDGVPCDRDIAPYVVVRKSRPGGSNLKTPRGAELVDHRFTSPFALPKMVTPSANRAVRYPSQCAVDRRHRFPHHDLDSP